MKSPSLMIAVFEGSPVLKGGFTSKILIDWTGHTEEYKHHWGMTKLVREPTRFPKDDCDRFGRSFGLSNEGAKPMGKVCFERFISGGCR